MIEDYYNIIREIKHIEQNKFKDETVFFKKINRLKRIVFLSNKRYLARAQNIPPLQFPPQLPISSKRHEIIDSIKKHQVTIITGETGSGKTTQIPKMCLAAGLGRRGIIGLTQPRRIAATSIAQRIAAECGEECGKSIAYKIRFEEKTSAEPLIKVMTDGILLAETVNDRDLLAYDTIIVDEAHERSLNIDFILGYLRTLLIKRKDLKVIITSATIDTAKFSEAFDNAPVIKVSGRMYPVEVRYRPVGSVKEEKGETTYVDEAVACVESLQRERRYEDILIFMPTEQDIRETCGFLDKKCTGLVLPLYARLSGSQQRLIFNAASEQKIIVATNIAETSLTIPGIKYVIDAGLARILEYNPRSQTTGLPIKPISLSSAEQRKGRCGRVQNGICIRLYSQEEFSQKPLYTPPEIMRSNLAGVILRMLSLNLGSVNSFPFVDRPQPKSIRDGIDILDDLGALTRDDSSEETNLYKLTEVGRTMAEFPLDPRVSRMLIEAKKEKCVNEIAVIAAALSIQDPRERPYDKVDQASSAHALFAHPESDFLTYLNIWNRYHGSLESLPSQSKLRKFCRDHFLSYKRMIEWRDIYHQILDIIDGTNKTSKGGAPPAGAGGSFPKRDIPRLAESIQPTAVAGGFLQRGKKHVKIEVNQEISDKIHRCILSGYLSNIAQKKEKNFYNAAKSRAVMIFPGSGLFNRAGLWIVAAEISMTSRVFARNVANIKSEWLEELGRDNCRYTYAAAHWEKNRGQVVALEKVTLFGLTIVESRPVAYERINAEEARSIFIREALVTGEVARRIPFLEHNLSLFDQVKTMEEKLRKRGLVVDEETIARLYEQRLPVISDIRSLLSLIREKGSDEFLRFREEDLIAHEPNPEEISQYPDQIKIGDTALACHYNFEPGHSDDGVTVNVPLGLVSRTAEENIDRYLPSLLQEKAVHLLKSLPKSIRLKLPPPVQIAQLLREDKSNLNKSLPQALSQLLQDKYKVTVLRDTWAMDKLPAHLNVRYSVIDEKGKEIKNSRDIGLLRKELAETINTLALDKIRGNWEKDGITRWDFGELPEQIPLTGIQGLIGYAYPALHVIDDSINLRLYSDRKESASSHGVGVVALYEIHFAEKLKQLKKNVTLSSGMKTIAANIGNPKQLEQSIINRIKKDLFFKPWRKPEEFMRHADALNAEILPYGQGVLVSIDPVLKAFDDTYVCVNKLIKKNTGNTPVLKFLKDIRTELQSLVPINFPELYAFDRMKDLPRYCKALILRAERGSLNLTAAQKKKQEVLIYSRQLQQMLTPAAEDFISSPTSIGEISLFKNDVSVDYPEEKIMMIEELFWMIEEYKVSLFAQELKTPYPVSPKKLNQMIEEIEKL
jgi:ATP-dependent helicase HrpA